MRAHTTTTTTTTKSRPRRKARHVVLALALGICALAIPAGAIAEPQPDGYSSVNSITGDSSDSSQAGGAAAAGLAHRTPTELAQRTAPTEPGGSGGSPTVDSGYSSLNAISGAPASEPTLVSSPTDPSNGFDWGSAAVGAGAAMALVALGGAGFLTVRRRPAVSPSAVR